MRFAPQWVGGLILGLSLLQGVCFAGVEEARKYIDEAAELIKGGDNEKAGTKLDLAEVELEGIDASTAGPLKTQIETLRKSMSSAADAEARTELMREVERLNRNTQESIGNVSAFDSNAKELMDLLTDPKNARLIGEEDTAKFIKQLEGYKKVHAKKAIDVYAERIESRVKGLEDEWPEHKKELTEGSPAAQQSAARDVYNDMGTARNLLQDLPADNEKRKAFEARIAKIETEYNQIMGASQVKEVVDRLNEGWARVLEETKGWEAETTGPAFKDYMNTSSEEMSYLNLPKTGKLIGEISRFLEIYPQGENYEAVKNDPQVKAIIDNARKLQAEARAKAVKVATAVVEDAEKTPRSDYLVSAVNRLGGGGSRGSLHMLIGDDAPELKGLVDRCNAIVAKEEQVVASAKAAKAETLKKLTEEAEKAWPAMAAKFDAVEGFDPDNPPVGKYVRFKDINNRMGWDYGSDDLHFASRVNGKPFAGRFDPVVLAAFKEVNEKTGGGVEDGGWDLIGIVEKGTVRITERVKADVRDKGNSSVGTLERWDPIDVPYIKVVAVHAGPVAVAVGSGAVKEDGKIEAPKEGAAGTSASGSSGTLASSGTGTASVWFWRLLTLLVGVAAAAACLMKANYAPLVAVPQAGQVQTKLGGENLAIIGLVCAVIGLIFLLRGYVYYGFLTNLAIIAAGLYAALDWLQGRGIVKPELAAQVRPLGVPIGLACAGLAIVSLLLGLIGLNLYVV